MLIDMILSAKNRSTLIIYINIILIWIAILVLGFLYNHNKTISKGVAFTGNNDITSYINQKDPFSINIVHSGGYGSEIYTATAWVDVDSGVPVPANDLINVSFTRGGVI